MKTNWFAAKGAPKSIIQFFLNPVCVNVQSLILNVWWFDQTACVVFCVVRKDCLVVYTTGKGGAKQNFFLKSDMLQNPVIHNLLIHMNR